MLFTKELNSSLSTQVDPTHATALRFNLTFIGSIQLSIFFFLFNISITGATPFLWLDVVVFWTRFLTLLMWF